MSEQSRQTQPRSELSPAIPAAEDDAQQVWREPQYSAADAKPPLPYSPTHPGMNTEPRPRERERHHRGKAVALCAVCLGISLIFGAAAGAIAAIRLSGGRLSPSAAVDQIIFDSVPGLSGAVSRDESAPVGAGIYAQAETQVVGLRVTVTASDALGRIVSAPVSGSGMLLSSDGYILTDYSAVKYAALYGFDLTVFFADGSEQTADITGCAAERGLAVLKVDKEGLAPAGICTSVSVGEDVYVISGSAGDGVLSERKGIVSAVYHPEAGSESPALLRIDADVDETAAGAPVYNADGRVIGIVTAGTSSDREEGLVLPITEALDTADALIHRDTSAGEAYLGVSVQDVSEAAAFYYHLPVGAFVYSVEPESAAEAAGLQSGDIIVALGESPVTGAVDLKSQLRRFHPGDAVVLTFFRDGAYLQAETALGSSAEESRPG